MSSASKKEVLRQTHIREQQLFITEDDHRNNDHFLKLHPNTVVRGKLPKTHKVPSQLNSVEKHLTGVKTLFVQPVVSAGTIKDITPEETENNSVYEKQTEKMALGSSTSNVNVNSREELQSFTFHEIATEDYDLQTDLEIYGSEEDLIIMEGSMKESIPEIIPPANITIDSNSLMLQTDAQDGTVTFKASVQFSDEIDLSEYDIIVTQVTTV